MSSYFSQLVAAKPRIESDTSNDVREGDPNNYFGEPENETNRQRTYDLDFISKSGLFETRWYLAQYPDIAQAGVSPLDHFFDFGYKEGRRPNLYFEPQWYLTQNPDIVAAGVHPLTHYASYGDLEGRKPSLLFDPTWYRKRYALGDTENALAHYIKTRTTCRFSPIQDFDVEHYSSSYPDVVAAAVDPFEHFITYGYMEGRTPSLEFDPKFYWNRYLGSDTTQNPFLHFLAHKHEAGVYGRMPPDEASIPREVKRYTKQALEFEEFSPLPASAPRRAKLLAYYLPQFHSFPENDDWWGKGFTEWTNVPRGLPRFRGHYQPRIPRDLGFYSLSHPDAMRKQVELAKAGGVYGFIFYYYWFNGKRLLEKPIEQFLIDRSIEMPFSLMWANENWTRRWDGADSEVLISQDYRPEDELNLAADFVRHFKDPRYIRIGTRPLLMIYRPGLISEAFKTITRLRLLFTKTFGEDPLLVMAQTFDATNPTDFAMDGAIEFPPHKLTKHIKPANTSLQYLDIEFEGKAYRYDDVVSVSLDEAKAAFPLIKTAVPSWDNDARRQGNGLVLIDSTPQKYQAWLSKLVDQAVDHPFFGEPIVCVNAWNEWCEAAYLEPDLHFGAAYLNATARAMVGKTSEIGENKVLLVGHDCFPSGAQQLLLNICRTLRDQFGVEISIVVLQGGALEESYRELGPLKIESGLSALEAYFWTLKDKGFASAIVNTAAASCAVPALIKAGIRVTQLIHELPRILREKGLIDDAKTAALIAQQIVFPAEFVKEQFFAAVNLVRDKGVSLRPQGLYKQLAVSKRLRDECRKALCISKGQRLIIGMGYADLRKGFDLFLQIWRFVQSSSPNVFHFCWVGDIDPSLKDFMRTEIADAESTGSFHMPGYRKDVSAFFSGADAFALTSREDPFPSVVLEALYAGLRTFAFDNAGGIPELLKHSPLGHVVPFGDTVGMSQIIISALRRGVSDDASEISRVSIANEFNFKEYVWGLLELASSNLPVISVAVPNFNYARHMPKRLSSIFLQTQPVKEVLILDDCSTDESLTVIPKIAMDWQRSVLLIPNKENSGSVFKQWRKAAECASGEYLWIAEADDLSNPAFLTKLVALMRHDPSVQFVFSDSKAIDASDVEIWSSYKEYFATVGQGSLTRTEVVEARHFAQKYLSVKNLILNVSSVLWRREALLDSMNTCGDELQSFKMAGDWRLYLQALAKPGASVGYISEPLNIHRRHADSVTHMLSATQHVAEIRACQDFAREAFDIPEGVKVAQQLYLQEVTSQLNIIPNPEINELSGQVNNKAKVRRRAQSNVFSTSKHRKPR